MSAISDPIDIELLELMQATVPVGEHPFGELARQVGAGEDDVLERVRRLKAAKVIRQISAIFDTRSLGYESSLVAARVEPSRADEAAAIISRHPGVSHNYLRNHAYNLWYTIAVSPLSKLGLEKTVALLHQQSGAESTRLLPTLKLYKIGVQFNVGGESRPDDLDAVAYSEKNRAGNTALAPADIEFVRVMQRDLPVTPDPFADYAKELGMSLAQLAETARRFTTEGKLRRFAAVLHHRNAGFSANAMGVWSVPGADNEIDRVGERLAGFRAVSHCYRRPSYPDWPFNIFTMVHGKSRDDCEQALRAMSEKTGLADFAALYSTKEYKKVRVRYFTEQEQAWESANGRQ
ncbi:MAG TPA: Lrp/AsnC family transcriptional regulator [Verrucomicrobiae bacterium]|nr:Lrp/AsnC family transcriptional regulator [Verrucomicrobiae bacterium]